MELTQSLVSLMQMALSVCLHSQAILSQLFLVPILTLKLYILQICLVFITTVWEAVILLGQQLHRMQLALFSILLEPIQVLGMYIFARLQILLVPLDGHNGQLWVHFKLQMLLELLTMEYFIWVWLDLAMLFSWEFKHNIHLGIMRSLFLVGQHQLA